MKTRSFSYFTYLAVPVVTLLFLHLLMSYWRYFHMGSAGGNAAVLLYLVLPLSLVLFSIAGMLANRMARRYGWKPGVRRAATAFALFCVLALLFWGETSRTKDYPLESEEPVDVSEFLQAYLGIG